MCSKKQFGGKPLHSGVITLIQFGVLIPAAIAVIFISIPTRAIGSLING